MDNTFEIIEELASDKYMGRLTGTDGNRMSVDYIADYFNKIGLESPTSLDGYKQPYTQKSIVMESTPVIRLQDKGGNVSKEFNYLFDYRIMTIWEGLNIQGSVTTEMIVIDNFSKLNDDNQNLEGKVLLIENSVLSPNRTAYDILHEVLKSEQQVDGIILNLDNRRTESYLVSTSLTNMANNIRYNSYPFDNKKGPIMAYATDAAFQELKNAADDKQHINMSVDYNYIDTEADNVIGVIAGSDVDLKDQYIIISAHLDHVGDNKNGTYQPGVLDNASGTALLMELARVLKEAEVVPKKTIVFIAFNGEEQGLFGSNYYVKNPVYSLNDSVVINLDMVGTKEVVALTIGSELSGLKNELYDLAVELDIESEKTDMIASDQRSFTSSWVEAVTLIHNDGSKIHTTFDTIDNIDLNRMEEVARLILYYIDKNAY